MSVVVVANCQKNIQPVDLAISLFITPLRPSKWVQERDGEQFFVFRYLIFRLATHSLTYRETHRSKSEKRVEHFRAQKNGALLLLLLFEGHPLDEWLSSSFFFFVREKFLLASPHSFLANCKTSSSSSFFDPKIETFFQKRKSMETRRRKKMGGLHLELVS